MSDPSSPASADFDALCGAAGRALQARDAASAKALYEQALALNDKNPAIWLNLATAQLVLSDLPAAMAATNRALQLAPRLFTALLFKATLLERMGQGKRAALAYGAALVQAPPESQMDAATLRAVRHGRGLNRQYVADLHALMVQEVKAIHGGARDLQARRVELFVDATLRMKKIYRQEPTEMLYPGLPAIEFFERDQFPWLESLEAATPAIRQELQEVLATNQGMTPYLAYKEDLPLEQWAELNFSERWSAFHIQHHGALIEEHAKRCPQTLAAVAQADRPQAHERMPNTMFSILKPRTKIPPHNGIANVRLVVHLPLIVPPDCALRVGNETRPWRLGEAMVFDDTIEHEAWNNSDSLRAVLLFDIWHPHLSAMERQAISGVLSAIDQFNGFKPDEDF